MVAVAAMHAGAEPPVPLTRAPIAGYLNLLAVFDVERTQVQPNPGAFRQGDAGDADGLVVAREMEEIGGWTRITSSTNAGISRGSARSRARNSGLHANSHNANPITAAGVVMPTMNMKL